MAKGGRKLTASSSELYLGTLSYGHGQGTSPEFAEDEVWSVVDDDDRADGIVAWETRASSQDSDAYVGRPAAERRRHRQAGGLSVAFVDDPGSASPERIVHQFRPEPPRGRQVAASAPMDVPDWSKIYRVEALPEWDEGSDDSEGVVPPHEYLARSRKMAANSMFEGVGRTLKGRDLSRVRDAVWSQTGFDG